MQLQITSSTVCQRDLDLNVFEVDQLAISVDAAVGGHLQRHAVLLNRPIDIAARIKSTKAVLVLVTSRDNCRILNENSNTACQSLTFHVCKDSNFVTY